MEVGNLMSMAPLGVLITFVSVLLTFLDAKGYTYQEISEIYSYYKHLLKNNRKIGLMYPL